MVADEVRDLAHRTQGSAQEIEKIIEELQVGEQLNTVKARIGEIEGMNQSVATATEDQTSVIASLNM